MQRLLGILRRTLARALRKRGYCINRLAHVRFLEALLYRLLEEQVVPLYYDRDAAGIPRGWVKVMKEAMRTSIAAFSMRRMIKEYVEQMYLPSMR